jgi:hypothetical protein
MFWQSRDWGLIGYVRATVEWSFDGDDTGDRTYLVWKLFVCSKTGKRKYEFNATGYIQYKDFRRQKPDYGRYYPQVESKLIHWKNGVPIDFGDAYIPNTHDLKCIWSGERYDLGDKHTDNVLTPPED